MFYGKIFSCKVVIVLVILHSGCCSMIPSTDFNAKIRDYSTKQSEDNSSNVKTLQKEDQGRYANFAPVTNVVRFKEEPDNAISSSSHSRGLQHYDHSGHASHDDYEEVPYLYGYGYPDIHGIEHHPGIHHYGGHHDDHHEGHHSGHYGGHGHHGGHHSGYGLHHKYYDHGLATKTLIWPIAGLALLGAAAALVTNPVLLQLGVVSGRRRRDTDALTSPIDMYAHNTQLDIFEKTKLKDNCKGDEILGTENFGQVNENLYPKDNTVHDFPKHYQKQNIFERKVNEIDAVIKLIRKSDLARKNNKEGMLKEIKQVVLLKRHPIIQSAIETVTMAASSNDENKDDNIRYVPVPLKNPNN